MSTCGRWIGPRAVGGAPGRNGCPVGDVSASRRTTWLKTRTSFAPVRVGCRDGGGAVEGSVLGWADGEVLTLRLLREGRGVGEGGCRDGGHGDEYDPDG